MTAASDTAPAADPIRSAGSRARHLGRSEQVPLGIAERKLVPRRLLGAWSPASDRPDPIAILEAQHTSRVPELVPIRVARMVATPFAFYRGAAAIMAADLDPTPRTRLGVQLCGDAHLSNFGVYASPERTLVFDLNDFDETHPGPFEWDVKRLAASFIVAGRTLGWSRGLERSALLAAVGTYRRRLRELARGRSLDTWYSRIAVEDLRALLPRDRRHRLDALVAQAARRDNLGALAKLTVVVDGKRQLREQPPLMVRPSDPALEALVEDVFRAYRRTLAPDRRQLLDRYRFADLAHKVVGVGSVGTRCWVVYLEGVDDGDPLFLQVKEAQASVLEPYLGRSKARHHGRRVVLGQRLTQAASDVFLGWVTGPQGRHFYWRQLWDAKLSADLERYSPAGITAYANACGMALARAHARSGSGIAIAAYLGASERFDRAMLEFGEAYADQNERDHAALVAAVASGRLVADAGATSSG
jgi:uncharacterized protein (DUF2252 family)